MQSEMIERVAKVIGDALTDRDGWLKKSYSDDDVLAMARAAVEAMREPTAAMIDAGCEAGFRASGDQCRDENHEPPSWRAMIDAALTPSIPA